MTLLPTITDLFPHNNNCNNQITSNNEHLNTITDQSIKFTHVNRSSLISQRRKLQHRRLCSVKLHNFWESCTHWNTDPHTTRKFFHFYQPISEFRGQDRFHWGQEKRYNLIVTNNILLSPVCSRAEIPEQRHRRQRRNSALPWRTSSCIYFLITGTVVGEVIQ